MNVKLSPDQLAVINEALCQVDLTYLAHFGLPLLCDTLTVIDRARDQLPDYSLGNSYEVIDEGPTYKRIKVSGPDLEERRYFRMQRRMEEDRLHPAALDLPCHTCTAEPGEPCHTAGGDIAKRHHKRRYIDAANAEHKRAAEYDAEEVEILLTNALAATEPPAVEDLPERVWADRIKLDEM